jgi:hypothetical protein
MIEWKKGRKYQYTWNIGFTLNPTYKFYDSIQQYKPFFVFISELPHENELPKILEKGI